MAETKPLAFGDAAKFLTDTLGVKGTVVLVAFENGNVGITSDALTGQDVQNILAGGIYLNQAEIVRRNNGMVLQ